jgi:hypothetical protein
VTGVKRPSSVVHEGHQGAHADSVARLAVGGRSEPEDALGSGVLEEIVQLYMPRCEQWGGVSTKNHMLSSERTP